MKTCKQCGITKPLSDFNTHAQAKDGYRALCKPCKAASLRAWRNTNADVVLGKQREYYALKMRTWFQRLYLENKSALNARAKVWRTENPDQNTAKQARRRSAKLCATPNWADNTKIAAVYKEAAAIRALGVDCHVDHIYPLQGRAVCGLHVHNNLQIMLAEDNLAKGNKLQCP